MSELLHGSVACNDCDDCGAGVPPAAIADTGLQNR